MLLVECKFALCDNAVLVAKDSAPFIVERPVGTSRWVLKDGCAHEALGLACWLLHLLWLFLAGTAPLALWLLHLPWLSRVCWKSSLGFLAGTAPLALPWLSCGCWKSSLGPLARAAFPCPTAAPGSRP